MKISGEFIPDGMNSFERNVKRVGDCIIASILMMLFSPLFLVCYIAVKREDGGPVIFQLIAIIEHKIINTNAYAFSPTLEA